MTYLQPREGITGTLRDEDDLLSLEDKAWPRRKMMMAMGYAVWRECMAPYNKMWERMRNPQVGDLVMETTSLFRMRPEAFGYLVGHQEEWAETDEEYNQRIADEGDLNDGWRGHDDYWYVQYGPNPDDVCRWGNCSFIAVPTDLDFGR